MNRYETMKYVRCGKSGIKLPVVSLGLWHNFGDSTPYDNAKKMVTTAFDLGINHFDLANNYGPPGGSAETTFGKIVREELASHRDELLVSTKAGYFMWPGPYGEWGSRKYILSSLDKSLRRLGLDYVDIMYSHRPDPDTPIEETMGALDHCVRSGKAVYAGISNYNLDQTKKALAELKRLGTPCLIHQAKYSMFNRWVEDGLLDELEREGAGCIAFSPLAQGLLTDRYLGGVPADSRIAGPSPFLKESDLTGERVKAINRLSEIARSRGQSLSALALAWVLRKGRVASALIGASKPEQVVQNVRVVERLDFTDDELVMIEEILR